MMVFLTPIISIIALILYFNHRLREQSMVIKTLQDNTIEGLMQLHSNLGALVEHLADRGVISVKFQHDTEAQTGSDKPDAASVLVEDKDGRSDA